MKKTILFFSLVLALLLSSCAAHYREDPDPTALCERALAPLSADDFRADTENTVLPSLPRAEAARDVRVFYTARIENVDEFGILLARDEESAQALEKALREDYLPALYEKNRDFYDSYIPLETPKLRDAEVRCYGTAVVYAILSPADRAALFHAVEKYMKESIGGVSNCKFETPPKGASQI